MFSSLYGFTSTRKFKYFNGNKKEAELSDSFLAQGGICMLRNEEDYDSYLKIP